MAISQDFGGWYATVGVHPHDCEGFDTTTTEALHAPTDVRPFL